MRIVTITIHHRIDDAESWQVSDSLGEDADEKCDDDEFETMLAAEDEAGMRESQYRAAGYVTRVVRS